MSKKAIWWIAGIAAALFLFNKYKTMRTASVNNTANTIDTTTYDDPGIYYNPTTTTGDQYLPGDDLDFTTSNDDPFFDGNVDA